MVRIISEEESIEKARPIVEKSKKTRLRYFKGRFEVTGLKCQKCFSSIWAVACHISKKEPDGIVWYCEFCGEVDDWGDPTPEEIPEPEKREEDPLADFKPF